MTYITTPEFDEKLKRYKLRYDLWIDGKIFDSCRLVHYCGIDAPSAMDVESNSIWERIEMCLAEGFLVNWNLKNTTIYICVQEPGCPIPSWDKVYKEKELENVDQILIEAGFAL